MVFEIDDSSDELYFPDPHLGDDDGCFAVGGDLSIDRLLLAYSNGIFPWYSFRDQDEPLWFCPMQRFVIFPDEIHVSHSMRTLMNKNKYSVGINEAFDEVIRAYTALHEQGFAASVEVWDNETNELVGGLYGVTIGKVFIGESMFSKVPSASKLALIFLARYLKEHGGKMIDCQLETPHLKSMGGRYISYEEYMRIMNEDS